jgi:hypothetical protein
VTMRVGEKGVKRIVVANGLAAGATAIPRRRA